MIGDSSGRPYPGGVRRRYVLHTKWHIRAVRTEKKSVPHALVYGFGFRRNGNKHGLTRLLPSQNGFFFG